LASVHFRKKTSFNTLIWQSVACHGSERSKTTAGSVPRV